LTYPEALAEAVLAEPEALPEPDCALARAAANVVASVEPLEVSVVADGLMEAAVEPALASDAGLASCACMATICWIRAIAVSMLMVSCSAQRLVT
jgi:hypothetical protein